MARASKVCATLGCPTLTPGTHCPEHTLKPWSTHGAGKGRGRPWRRARWARFVVDDFTCVEPGCGHRDPTGKSLEAHHVGPTDLVEDLRSLCKPHHLERTLADAAAARRR